MESDDLADFAFDHVDKTVAQLIGSRNYKQALKTFEKKRKKGTSPSVQQDAVKAALLCALGDHDASHTVVVQILAAYPPPYQSEVCGILYLILCDLSTAGVGVNEKSLEAVWFKTIAAETRPDEKVHLVKEWMFMAIRRGHWNFVVKASQQLSSLVAGDSAEVLKQWTLQLCARYLYHLEKLHNMSNGSDLDRRLVLQILQKAAKDAPAPLESTREAGRWIATDKHLKLLAEVYQRERQLSQLLTLLEEPKFARLVDGNNEFICMKVSLCQKAIPGNHRKVLDWATMVMIDSFGEGGQWLRDDWRLWHVLAYACSMAKQQPSSGTQSTREVDLRNLVTTHSPSAPMNRAPTLALLDFTLLQDPDAKVHASGDTVSYRVEACVEFFRTHVDRDFAALDIQPRLRSMSIVENKQVSLKVHRIIEDMEKTAITQGSNDCLLAWVRAATNALTIDRVIYDAAKHYGSGASHSVEYRTLVDYIGLCVNLYKQIAQLDNRQKLSLSNTAKINLENVAWSLSMLNQSGGDPSLIYLRGLVNCLQQDLGQTDDWRVRVISDLQSVGSTSQAWNQYTKLEVKHMLVESAGPMMFCQISTTLPFGVKGFDPHLEVNRHLKFYREMLSIVPQHQELALEHQNYDQCMRMHDFLSEVKASPVRWMLGLERRRISRLRGLAYDGDDILHDPAQMPTLSELTRDLWAHAPTMTHDYIHLLAYIDDLDECIRRPAEDEGVYLDRLRIRRPKLRTSSRPLRSFDILLVLAEGLKSRDVDLVSEGQEVLNRHISNIEEDASSYSIVSEHGSDPIPAYDFTHSFDLEFLQMCTKVCKKLPNRFTDRKVKTEATSLTSAAKKAAEALHRSTRQRLDSLKVLKKDSTMVAKLLYMRQQASFQTSIMEIVGQARAQEYFVGLIESRTDTENSLLKILVG